MIKIILAKNGLLHNAQLWRLIYELSIINIYILFYFKILIETNQTISYILTLYLYILVNKTWSKYIIWIVDMIKQRHAFKNGGNISFLLSQFSFFFYEN